MIEMRTSIFPTPRFINRININIFKQFIILHWRIIKI